MIHILIVFLSLLPFSLQGLTSAILQADIRLLPQQTVKADQVKPDTPIGFKIVVSNLGADTNPPLSIYIRFAYSGPRDKSPDSEIFRTEELQLPPILPGKSVTLQFQKQHKWPSIFQFLRQDWNLRQYQAVVETADDHAYIIGTAGIGFCMYYYPGPTQELPKEVILK